MSKRPRIKYGPCTKSLVGLCVVTGGLFFFMLVPVFTALSAGIAAVSLFIFAIPLALTAVMMAKGYTKHPCLYAVAVLSVAGLAIPQIGYLQVASVHHTPLAFSPVSYLRFSGKTDLAPTTTVHYLSKTDRPMPMAVYNSALPGPRPTVVLLHGGGWRYGNYLETGAWPKVLSTAGYTVISVEYTLSSPQKPTWDIAPDDVRRAMQYLATKATALHIDPRNITLMGQSAGGHLALLDAYTSSVPPASVIALYPPTDLVLDYQTSRDKSAELVFIGGTPAQFPSRYRDLSPHTRVSRASPRTLLLQGTRDDLVTDESMDTLVQALRRHDVPHTAIALPLTGHSFENQRGGFATQIAEQAVLRFLRND